MDEISSIVSDYWFIGHFTMGCNGVKHVLQIEEPTDHTQGDDGGKLKYKIIWGDINQKE